MISWKHFLLKSHCQKTTTAIIVMVPDVFQVQVYLTGLYEYAAYPRLYTIAYLLLCVFSLLIIIGCFCHPAVLAFTLWCRFFHSIGEKLRLIEVMLPAQDATAELRLKSRSDAKPELFLLCWAASLKNWGTSIGLVIGSTWEKFGLMLKLHETRYWLIPCVS